MEIKTTHTLINGDSRNLSLIPDKSVHLIITSPPYWQLKDYGTDSQIGFHDSYESYINNLKNRNHSFLRVARNGLYGSDYMEKADHNEHDRWRSGYGKFPISSERYSENRL